jgi:ethanolamine phosphate transferase 2 subunit G
MAFFMQLPLLRVIRAWNQTGQKFAGEPDIVKSILQPNPDFLALLVILTYVHAGYALYCHSFAFEPTFRRVLWPLMLVGTSLVFKISMASEAGEYLPIWLRHIPSSWSLSVANKARMTFLSLLAGIIWFSVSWFRKSGRQGWIQGLFPFIHLFLLGQARLTNIPLYVLFSCQRHLLSLTDPSFVAITHLLLQHVSFFSLGNSNSLSSIDLSNAYNGITTYSIPLVGLLTFISNWSGPLWWIVSAQTQFLGPAALFHGTAMLFLMIACVVLRNHLFIWTVFSPKFLFQTVWIGLGHWVVGGVFALGE